MTVQCFIFTEGNKVIGMGHILRTLSLAKQLRERGLKVIYVTSPSSNQERIHSEGFETLAFKGFPLDFTVNDLDSCIIDHYNVTFEFFTDLSQIFSTVAYIDDLNLFDYPVDIIINGTASACPDIYRNQSHATKLLLGLPYNLVDKRFCVDKTRKYRNKAEKVLVTMGGSDPINATQKLMDLLEQACCQDDLSYHVVSGMNFPYGEALQNKFMDHQNISFHKDISDLLPLMLDCDFAFSAGGITLYELIASGTPSVSVITADNQAMQVKALAKKNIVPTLGPINEMNPHALTAIIESFSLNYESWVKRAQEALSIVDGNGAGRIAEELIKRMV